MAARRTRYAMSGKLSREANPHNFEQIEREFERLYASLNEVKTAVDANTAATATIGGGDVVGPAASSAGDLAQFDGTTGKLLKDTGVTTSAIIAAAVAASGGGDVVGPAGVFADAIALFDGTTGKLIKAATGTGFPKILSGVLTGAGLIDLTADVTGLLPLANIAGLPVTSQSGNPQGVVSAPVGQLCVDTGTGYLYQKLGGGSTAYGWYLAPPFGAGRSHGPRPFFFHTPMDIATVNTTATLVGNFVGFAQPFTASSLNNQTKAYLTGGGVFSTFDTGTTSGDVSSIASTGSQFDWWDQDFDLVWKIRTPTTITNLRLWAGLAAGAITDTDTLANGSNGAIGFRYSTVVPDGGFVGYTDDGTANHAVTATVATIAALTIYLLRIRFVRTGTPTVYFSVNDGTEIAQTLRIPSTGVTSFFVFGGSTQTGAARTFQWESIGGHWGS